MAEIDSHTREFIDAHRVARLATAGGESRLAVIPICYTFDGEHLYSPIDETPKRMAARQLRRVREIELNPHVSLVIDDYSEDWHQLAYVLIGGRAEILKPRGKHRGEHSRAVKLLRAKYPQYAEATIDKRPIIKVTPVRVKRWNAQPSKEQPRARSR